MPKARPKTIDQYIGTFPADVQQRLQAVRRTIRTTAPAATEGISYGMPAFKLNGRVLVYFAAWKEHIGLYAMPSTNAAFQKELSSYTFAKGSVQFPFDKPLPLALIGRMVKFRVRTVLEKA